jgi:hypothetical protein
MGRKNPDYPAGPSIPGAVLIPERKLLIKIFLGYGW